MQRENKNYPLIYKKIKENRLLALMRQSKFLMKNADKCLGESLQIALRRASKELFTGFCKVQAKMSL